MNEEELMPESSRSLESLRIVRLNALLRDMLRDEGVVKTARLLGVTYRTLVRAVESDSLSGRMSHALERHLLLGGGSAAARQQERVEALEQQSTELKGRLEAVGMELRSTRTAFESGIKALREEQAQGVRGVDRRLAGLESRQIEAGPPPPAGMEGGRQVGKRAAARREYPELVTLDPEPGEEQVYGEATPLIVQWRKVRDDHHEARDRLGRAEAEERMRELEIAMIEEHKLTLPPARYPWDNFDRRDEVWSRRQTLARVRGERARAHLRRWLRRVLTLGLWWK